MPSKVNPAVFLLAGLLWLWPLALQPTAVPFRPGADYSDLLISHWPNAEYMRHSIWTWGEIPLWNRWRLGGMPFLADPLSGIGYPPNWLLLFVPLEWGFNLLLWLHLTWAGFGMQRFLRALGVSSPAALLAGLAFAGMPKLIAHAAAGHVSLVYAVAWTPWLLQAVHALRLEASWRRGMLAGLLLALTFLADARWSLYAGVFAATYWIATGAVRSAARPRAVAKGLSAVFVTAGLVPAVIWLPLLELLRYTSRAALSLEESATYSLPLRYAIGLLIPDRGGFPEWMTYSGLAVAALAGVAILVHAPRGAWTSPARDWFWLVAVICAWLFALGSNTPVYGLLLEVLPGLGWLRVPPRALFVAAFCLIVLAARGADALAAGVDPSRKRILSLATTAFASFALMLALAVYLWTGSVPASLIGFAILSVLISLVLGWSLRHSPAGKRWWVALGLLVVGDLLWMNASLLEARPLQSAWSADPIGAYLVRQAGPFRVYSPSYSLPQHVASRYALEQVDGVNPMQLTTTAEFIRQASGVGSHGYSVTLPDLGDNPAAHNRDAQPDLDLLGRLNVRFVLAEFDLHAPGLVSRARFGDTRIYENTLARGEAWLTNDPMGSDQLQSLSSTRRFANHTEYQVQVDQPALLVASEVAHPGWIARVDGQSVPIVPVDGLLRGVHLDAGQHRVQFDYRPANVIIGLVGSLLGLALVAGSLRWSK